MDLTFLKMLCQDSGLVVTGMTLPSPLAPDEKNGIPNSPQRAALTLDLDLEKETEVEPEEPQKPEKPSVFIVLRKVWLRYNPNPHPWGRESCSLQPTPETLRMD